LNLRLGPLALDTELSNVFELPPVTISFEGLPSIEVKHVSTVHKEPPSYVQPHPPYHVFPAPLYHARELTKPGAEKRTFHFDIDVTDYPDEGGLDFKVGGAIGVCPPNSTEIVDELFDILCIPKFVRDKSVTLKTNSGRWPTIWGEDKPRELITTRRELLTWCTDVQSHPPTKPLLRVMAEYADAPNEKKILEYLCSAEGQAAFCDLRTTSHITVAQLLHAFPSSKPDLAALLSVLNQLMPRFYSLSNDPHISSARPGLPGNRRLIEVAVTVHETPDWHADGAMRTGVGSGFMERLAQAFIGSENEGVDRSILDLRVPMFRGLMANPLSREFHGEGPMVLIGAGVGMAPFRGFILNRLKNANCANKIWLIQGVRDSMLDEIYSGELGDHEAEIKRVVQSRKVRTGQTEAKYVQDEVRMQADIVWFVINALDGRIFVCGSSKGMGEGVHQALIDVAMAKSRISEAEAHEFWAKKKEDGQYIAVSLVPLGSIREMLTFVRKRGRYPQSTSRTPISTFFSDTLCITNKQTNKPTNKHHLLQQFILRAFANLAPGRPTYPSLVKLLSPSMRVRQEPKDGYEVAKIYIPLLDMRQDKMVDIWLFFFFFFFQRILLLRS
jgi:sulfite reductase alpha subunit-like flavoprotein